MYTKLKTSYTYNFSILQKTRPRPSCGVHGKRQQMSPQFIQETRYHSYTEDATNTWLKTPILAVVCMFFNCVLGTFSEITATSCL